MMTNTSITSGDFLPHNVAIAAIDLRAYLLHAQLPQQGILSYRARQTAWKPSLSKASQKTTEILISLGIWSGVWLS